MYAIFRIGPDRAYPLHFTRPQLLLLPLLLGWNLFLLVFLALSFEMITFQPLIDFCHILIKKSFDFCPRDS